MIVIRTFQAKTLKVNNTQQKNASNILAANAFQVTWRASAFSRSCERLFASFASSRAFFSCSKSGNTGGGGTDMGQEVRQMSVQRVGRDAIAGTYKSAAPWWGCLITTEYCYSTLRYIYIVTYTRSSYVVVEVRAKDFVCSALRRTLPKSRTAPAEEKI